MSVTASTWPSSPSWARVPPLGRFTGVGRQRVSYCGAPDIEGKVTLTDENGDRLHLDYVGVRVDLFSYVCDLSVIKGTGRYKGATVQATLDIPYYSLDHPFDMTFDGTIQFP